VNYKSIAGQEFAIFRRTMQISDREVMDAENFSFALNCLKMGF